MKNTSKILALVLVLMTVLMSLSALTVSAAAPEKLYLTPSANWKESNARFAAYFFGNGEKWVSMTDPDGDGIYEVDVPAGYPNVIFCRMNPNAAANNWNNKWNQTSDLTIPTGGANHYTVKEGTWDKGGGTWSTFGSTCAHANLGPAATCTTPQKCLDCGDPVVSELGHTYNSAHLCTRCSEQATFTVAGSGAHLGTEWDTGNKANDMTYADGVYTKVYTNVAAGSYLLKVARDHDWGTSYPGTDKAYTVSTAGSTVTVTLKGTTVTVTVEAPHVCEFSDPTCTEPGKCSCGETQGEPTGHKIEGRACANGCGLSLDTLNFWVSNSSVYTVEGLNIKYNGATTDYPCVGSADAALFAAGHNTLTITITNNGSADSRVRVDVQGTTDVGNHKVLNTHAVGGDVWTDMEWGGSAVTVPAGESVTLTITYDESTDRGTVTNLIVFVDSCRGDGQTYNSDITLSDITFSTVVPHVNKLEVGETNKIVVDGDTTNLSGAYIEWVEFVVTEKAHYTFSGTYAFIYTTKDLMAMPVCGFTQHANLEPGTYYICIGDGTMNEFNIAVTKSSWVNTLVEGENKIYVDGDTKNLQDGNIEWVEFVVTEKANYAFTGTYAFIYTAKDLMAMPVCGFTGAADLEPGTYYICIGDGNIGELTVTLTKTAIEVGGDDPVDPEPTPDPDPVVNPALQLGDNTITIDGSEVNLTSKPIAWLEFTPEQSGVYTIASSDLTVYILTSKNMGDLNAYVGANGVAELTAGTTYYVLVGKDGITGEFTVNVSYSSGDIEVPVKNTIVVGENHYVITDALLEVGYEFLTVEITEPGVYKVSGGAPMKVYLFTVPGTITDTTPFGWNVDAMEEDGFADYFYVTLPEAGTYWFGVNYEYVTDEREFDITIELHTEHEYVEGKCECGAQEPVQEPDQPEQPGGDEPTDEPTTPAPELTLWDKIVAFIKRILAMILGFFKK